MSKNLRNIFILFDAEEAAIKKAHSLGYELDITGCANNFEVLELDKGDPSDMSEEEVKELREMTGL